jgi:hypothetical protein
MLLLSKYYTHPSSIQFIRIKFNSFELNSIQSNPILSKMLSRIFHATFVRNRNSIQSNSRTRNPRIQEFPIKSNSTGAAAGDWLVSEAEQLSLCIVSVLVLVLVEHEAAGKGSIIVHFAIQ